MIHQPSRYWIMHSVTLRSAFVTSGTLISSGSLHSSAYSVSLTLFGSLSNRREAEEWPFGNRMIQLSYYSLQVTGSKHSAGHPLREAEVRCWISGVVLTALVNLIYLQFTRVDGLGQWLVLIFELQFEAQTKRYPPVRWSSWSRTT